MTGSVPLRSRIHVSPRDWEGSGSPSVGARSPAVTNPPSQRVSVPETQGHMGGLPEGHGRARTRNWDLPQSGAWVLPRLQQVAADPGRGGSAGAEGGCASRAWGTRGRVRGAVCLGWATQAVKRNAW